MARNIDDIFNEISVAKTRVTELHEAIIGATASKPELHELNSTSQVAIWRLWAFVTAVVLWIHESLWDAFKAEVDLIAAEAVAGTPAWYAAKIKEFQYNASKNYSLVFNDNNSLVYDEVSTDDQIISHVSITELSTGIVLLKVAKDNGSGPEPLLSTELKALEGYLDKIKFAGTRTEAISLPADEATVSMNVYYDPVMALAQIQSQTELAIHSYLDHLDFDGIVYTEHIQDAVQAIKGVISVELLSVVILPSIAIHRQYTLDAGYVKIADTTPLSGTINYIPHV